MNSRPLPRCLSCVVAVLTVFMFGLIPAHAQFNNDTIIVTVPRENTEETASPPRREQAPARRPQATEKPKPRPKPAQAASASPARVDNVKIVVIVNDEAITQYEVDQRAQLLAGGASIGREAQAIFKDIIRQKSTNDRLRAILQETIEANRGKSREQILAIFERRKREYAETLQRSAVARAKARVLPGMRKKALEELIDERLQLRAAKEAKLLATEAEIDRVMSGIASRNKLNLKEFKAQLRRNGTDVNTMRQRIRASVSWSRLVGAKFGRFVDVNQKAIDESVSSSPDAEKVSLHLHSLTLGLPSKLNQNAIASRMAEAEQIRQRFTGCNATRDLAQASPNMIFRDLGFQIATSIPEPTRTILLNAKSGEMVPPVMAGSGVALYAVCGRREGRESLEARERARRELQAQGTEVYSRKYLADLRREAHIEYR